MRKLIILAAAAATALPAFVAPTFASAQAPRGVYYTSDPCRAEQRHKAQGGAVLGGIAGAVIGSNVAGRGNRTGGTIVGGALGAAAGHQIGKNSVSCGPAPRGVRLRAGCRWVTDHRGGRTYHYQVCRGRNGHWRPV